MIDRIWMLIIKEILALVRDPRSRLVLIGPPLVQLIVFAYAATLEVKNIELAIYNQDNGVYANEVVQRFVGSPYFKHIRFISHPQESQQLIDTQKVMGVIQIDAAFSRKILAGESAPLQVLLDARNSNSAQIVNGYIQEIINQLNEEIAQQLGKENRFVLIVRHWFNPNLDFKWFIVPGLFATLLAMVGIIVTGLSVAREREMGTFDQLLVSPLTPFEILLGKTIPALIIGAIQAFLLLLISLYWFQVPFVGSYLYLALGIILYLISVIGIGLFISSICATQQQAILGSFVFIVPAILISGFATPIENMPWWLQEISMADPIRHFLVIVRGLFLKDLPKTDIYSSAIPLLVISVVTMSCAAWLFNRRVG